MASVCLFPRKRKAPRLPCRGANITLQRAVPHLSWNEVRDRAIRFSRDPEMQRSRFERSEMQTFWNAFFDVFGLRRASLASFEQNVRNLRGNTSFIDLLWKGKLIVEHKSYGEDLSAAATQAFTYIEDLTREDRWEEIPRYVLVSDFARFVLYARHPAHVPEGCRDPRHARQPLLTPCIPGGMPRP